MKEKIEVSRSDLLKILDVLKTNEWFHRYRDQMNSKLHLAPEVRLSPLTSETASAKERLERMLEEL